ncbi:hypothetical protein CEXT_658691 [Caerostris extrusa]|uniref:Uncharacterized protein n=1 Tax=Caerostris extrusa TaxID=172846 RepID=A0AAV4RBV7_CAEEX|nr:hypothetical protein CEXT_658691 [Caerostris extrusa]
MWSSEDDFETRQAFRQFSDCCKTNIFPVAYGQLEKNLLKSDNVPSIEKNDLKPILDDAVCDLKLRAGTETFLCTEVSSVPDLCYSEPCFSISSQIQWMLKI